MRDLSKGFKNSADIIKLNFKLRKEYSKRISSQLINHRIVNTPTFSGHIASQKLEMNLQESELKVKDSGLKTYGSAVAGAKTKP